MGWEWEDSGKQLTEHHRITRWGSTQNIRRKLRKTKDKGENKVSTSAATFTAETEQLCK